MGPVKWSYFYLYVILFYVILDIFSRRVVGWRVERVGGRPCSRHCFSTP